MSVKFLNNLCPVLRSVVLSIKHRWNHTMLSIVPPSGRRLINLNSLQWADGQSDMPLLHPHPSNDMVSCDDWPFVRCCSAYSWPGFSGRSQQSCANFAAWLGKIGGSDDDSSWAKEGRELARICGPTTGLLEKIQADISSASAIGNGFQSVEHENTRYWGCYITVAGRVLSRF